LYVYIELISSQKLGFNDFILFSHQDSYSLCRIFKKTSPGPKIIEHQGGVHSQWAVEASAQLPAGDFTSDGRVEDMENSSPSEPMYPFDMMQGGPMHGANAETDDKWAQFLNEELLDPMASCYQDPAGFSTFPSKVQTSRCCSNYYCDKRKKGKRNVLVEQSYMDYIYKNNMMLYIVKPFLIFTFFL
jgi:hypothetical protein